MNGPAITMAALELRSAALSATRQGWPVTPGTFVGADRRWRGREAATTLRPIEDSWAQAPVTDPAEAYKIWSEQPYGVLLVCGYGVSVLELPERMMAVLSVLRAQGLVVPVIAGEPSGWLVITDANSTTLSPELEAVGARLHGVGSWVALPPTTVALRVTALWWVKPFRDHHGVVRLCPAERVQEVLLGALPRSGTGGGPR